MDPVAWDQVHLWSLQDIHTWLSSTDMLDCLPYLAQNNVTSGQSLLRLTDDTVMTWNLPVNQKSFLLQFIHANARLVGKKETKMKGIFETLSRRRRSVPRPIPADYCDHLDLIHTSSSSPALIVVEKTDIQAKILDIATSDWGSEFSDSDTETHHPTIKASKTSASRAAEQISAPLTLSDTLADQVPCVTNGEKPAQLTQEENALYEEPERGNEATAVISKNNRPEVSQKPTLPNKKFSKEQRKSNAIENRLSDAPWESNQNCVRKPDYFPSEYSVNAREVAQKLNILLANHAAAKNGLTIPGRTVGKSTGMTRQHSTPVMEAVPKRPPLMTSLSQQSPKADPLDGYSWYYGDIGRVETNLKLESDNTDGAFLIRKCRKGAQKCAGNQPYSLSLLSSGKVYHLTIRARPDDGRFALGFEKPDELTFPCVKDLVEHHLIHPVYLTECDRGVLLSFV